MVSAEQDARERYEQILREQPGRVDVLDSLAQLEFRSGNAAAASDLLRRAIQLSPQSAHLYTNLAATLAVQRQFGEAVSLFRQALALKPDAPEILVNLGAALKDGGGLDEAARIYRRVVELQPANADAHYRLAGTLKDMGDLDGATTAYRQTIALRPQFVQAHNDLASCLYLTRRFDEAIAEYELTIALRPDYPEAHNNLCISLHEVGRLEEARASARRALALRPEFPEAFYNLGRVLQDLDRLDEAIASFRRAVDLRPQFAEARNNLAIALEKKGLQDEAIEQYRQTLETRPDYLEAKSNLGVALKNSGRLDEAIETYNQVLAVAPDDHVARWNLGIALLLKGDFKRGWPAYEARRGIKKLSNVRLFPQPPWTGEPLEGRRILLHGEQGFGDAIQFIRYVPLVRQFGGIVVVLCHPGLRRLFAGQLGSEQVIADGEPLPTFDIHCPLLSLPAVLRTRLESIPAEVPYLRAEQRRADEFRARIFSASPRLRVSASPALKVGLTWAGSPAHVKDRERSLPLAALAPLAQVPNVRFFSLQKGERGDEAKSPPAGMELADFTSELADFADTAALISTLDLVICADTAVAHLAGALAKPVWVLLPYAPDWRWMLGRTDSPWYPTMRLFRQTTWGDWGKPIAQVVEELNLLVKR